MRDRLNRAAVSEPLDNRRQQRYGGQPLLGAVMQVAFQQAARCGPWVGCRGWVLVRQSEASGDQDGAGRCGGEQGEHHAAA
jgi:hypothetical protein